MTIKTTIATGVAALLVAAWSTSAQDCSTEKEAECLMENRTCANETCPDCVDGQIEIFKTCVIPDEIDFDSFQEALEPYLEFLPGQGVCSESGNTTCDAGQRNCVATDGVDDCGNCKNGWIEFEGDCIEIDAINFTSYVQTFEPVFVVDPPLTNEERAELIEFLARFISAIEGVYPPLPFNLGLNKYSADSPEEYRKLLGFRSSEGAAERFNIDRFNSTTTRRELQDLPDKVDWPAMGAMTEVKDQGRCGSCWAVSLMASVESAAALTNNQGFLQDLSFQQLISCDENNLGCNGGNIIVGMGYTWLNDFGGVTSLADYPYTDKGGTTTNECMLDDKNLTVVLKEPKVVFTVNDNMSFEERRDIMKLAVSIQPVTMALKSNCGTFQSYRKGILTDDGGCACQEISCIDHAVVLVGYDDTSNPPSWKLRNSWGTGWGEDGYFRIAQEGGGRWGLFGMLAEAVIPREAFNTSTPTFTDAPAPPTPTPTPQVPESESCISQVVAGYTECVLIMCPDADMVCTGWLFEADTCADAEVFCQAVHRECCPECSTEFDVLLTCVLSSAGCDFACGGQSGMPEQPDPTSSAPTPSAASSLVNLAGGGAATIIAVML